MAIAGILLAAGAARRFGGAKLLHSIDGIAIGLTSARTLKNSVARAYAVVPPGADALSMLFANAGLQIVVCDACTEGMGASLACGVRAANDADGWIIALADMPCIATATVTAVAQALRDGAPLVAPEHNGKRGHPVGFGKRYYAELVALSGDTGARSIVNRDASQLLSVAVDDPGIHRDIDTPSDLLPR